MSRVEHETPPVDPPQDTDAELLWAVREAWPPRTAAQWQEFWGQAGEPHILEAALAAHPDIVILRGRGHGQLTYFAYRRVFYEHVLGSFGRWCELRGPIPLETWAETVLRQLIPKPRLSLTPVFEVLEQAHVSATAPPSEKRTEPQAKDPWDLALGGAPAFRFKALFQLADLLGLRPRPRIHWVGSDPRLDLEYPGQRADEGPIWSDLVASLPDRSVQILSSRLFAGATHRRLARLFDVSNGRISQIEQKALRMIRHPRRSARLARRIVELLGTLSSPLVVRPRTLTTTLAPLLDTPIEPRVLLRFIEDLFVIDVEDLNGILLSIAPCRVEAFVPHKPETGNRPQPRFFRSLHPLWRAHQRLAHMFSEVEVDLDLVLEPGGGLQLKFLRGWVQNHLSEADQRIQAAFRAGTDRGILHLATRESTTLLPESLAFWRELGHLLVQAVCELGASATDRRLSWTVPAPLGALELLVRTAPRMPGGEYLSVEVLRRHWEAAARALREDLAAFPGTLQAFLDATGSLWHVPGRIHLYLTESRGVDSCPFQFHSTYATAAGPQGREAHTPLNEALATFAASADVAALKAVTGALARARERSVFLRKQVDSGRLLFAAGWTAQEAYGLLQSIGEAQRAGLEVHVPAGWGRRPTSRPRVRIRMGDRVVPSLGLEVLLDFSIDVVLDGETLDAQERARVLAATHGLMFLRGRWIEVDGPRLSRAVDHWQAVCSAGGGVPVRDAVKFLARVRKSGTAGAENDVDDWSLPESGPWLEHALAALTAPGAAEPAQSPVPTALPLRSYQRTGLAWLVRLYQLGLGGCLADDMGLGKTVQVLALIDWLRGNGEKAPHLVIVPASLLAHWEEQLRRFVPSVTFKIAHASWTAPGAHGVAFDGSGTQVVVISYTSVHRAKWLSLIRWGLIVLDEAQMIKTPNNVTTRAVKRLLGHCRLALTGTPIENCLTDLWSVFDYLNPGLLGSPEDFAQFLDRSSRGAQDRYVPLRRLTAPYLLRRRKTDPALQGELPAKIEREVPCTLSRLQAALYQQAVDELAMEVAQVSGQQYLGLVLAYLHRLKQICNHPSHWLGDGRYATADSGKFIRLRELGERLAACGEKVLVFTQYLRIADPLADLLAGTFGRRGLVMSSKIGLPQRRRQVELFQRDPHVPFMVMTLKTGGAGLNLTAASHIIHFDRWWNPAVENQATDRAHRLGQTRSVTVHKFICRGTLEERIDRLLREKFALSEEVLATDGEALLTRLTRDELLATLALDVNQATDQPDESVPSLV